MTLSSLVNFLNSLEHQGILANQANKKNQEFLDYSTRSTGKLFLTLTALTGALFAAAGVFSIISHNWDDFPKHLRGALSLMPALIALYFYYLAVFKYHKSTSWIEASSLFLMLMIGASIALVSQTYQMDGDFDKFIIIWLVLTIPLFYLAHASGIAIFYLLLSCKFLFPNVSWGFLTPSDYDLNAKYYLFWIFLFAFLPHFYKSLNKESNKQGFRAIFLGWVISIVLFFALPFAVQAGYLWWGVALLLGYYLVGKKYYGGNLSSLGRPFQTFTLYGLFLVMLYFTNDFFYSIAFRMDRIDYIADFDAEQLFFYFTGVSAVIILTIAGIKMKEKNSSLNRYVLFIPFLFVFLYLIYCLYEFADFNLEWFGFLVLNFYILGFGINSMIQGAKSRNVLYMIYGLALITALLWMRYFDLDLSFWMKGLVFIGVGGLFFLIHSLSADDYES